MITLAEELGTTPPTHVEVEDQFPDCAEVIAVLPLASSVNDCTLTPLPDVPLFENLN